MTRPFYLVGHNTNSIAEIERGLAAGLNAFEIDVNKDADGRLYASHDAVSSDGAAPPLVPFLQDLRRLSSVQATPPIALVLFDCKIDDPDLAVVLRNDVRTHLTDGGAGIPVIYSVPSIDRAGRFFEPIRDGLTPREGLMIDQEADATEVAQFFKSIGVTRACYGDGVTTLPGVGIGLPSPHLASEFDVAVAVLALDGLTFVYPWVLERSDTIREFVRIGVDGMIVDVENAATLVRIVHAPEFAAAIRPAGPGDDPFSIGAVPVVLEVVTGDVANAGTDAQVTFTLETRSGASIVHRFDGARVGRFERGTSTWVTLRDAVVQASDVVAARVQQDGAGGGPDWFLDSIVVRQRGAAPRRCVFNDWIQQGKERRAACE